MREARIILRWGRIRSFGRTTRVGNATFADVTVIWARDVADNQVNGFLVEKGTSGFRAEKMEGKIALRVVQNARITLDECRVPETHRLQRARSFRDTAAVLRMTRAGVAWQAVGCAMGTMGAAIAAHCANAKLTVQLLGELQRRGGRYGMVTMCVGGGQGVAGIFERLN